MHTQPILELHTVGKSFNTAAGELVIFKSATASIMPGEKVAIIGPSGSGKSTLLSLIGLLDTASEGEVKLAGRNVSEMSETEKSQFRNEVIGFIFQSFELISPFSVRENIAAPLEIAGKCVDKAVIDQMLEEVGLTNRAAALPYTLSGGEKQRVAIARALIHTPKLLLADEPTGSLDRVTGQRVLSQLLTAVSERNTTLVVITHDESIATQMDRVFEIKDQMLHERK